MSTSQKVSFGKPARELFLLAPDYLNLNHASYGSIPKAIQQKLRGYQDQIESRPDIFVRYAYRAMLDANRKAAAELIGVPAAEWQSVVVVPNVTTAINVVLRNMAWNDDGRDEILYFATIYGACNRTIDYVVDTRGSGQKGGHGSGSVSSRAINIAYPIEDDEILAAFQTAVNASKAANKRPRVCVYDVVSSVPGVRFPFEKLTKACRDLGIVSVVDGAQGIGMIPLNMQELDPDYFFTNCHKWLHVPRGTGLLYVPRRNQDVIRATIPVSHSYGRSGDINDNDYLGNLFEWVGTLDNSAFLCIQDAIRWRQDTFGGEEAIIAYTTDLARKGGQVVADILGTEVLDNKTHTATACSLVNVRLPLATKGYYGQAELVALAGWMMRTVVYDYGVCVVVYAYRGQLWTRLSAQVYLEVADFARTGRVLKELCGRVREKRDAKL